MKNRLSEEELQDRMMLLWTEGQILLNQIQLLRGYVQNPKWSINNYDNFRSEISGIKEDIVKIFDDAKTNLQTYEESMLRLYDDVLDNKSLVSEHNE